jgi:hypothetical protein
MHLKKTLTFILLLMLMGFSIHSPVENNNLVMKIATDNLSSMLAQIPQGSETRYGFASHSELTKAGIGQPYHVITFTDAFYTTDQLTNENYIQLQDEWRVPVTINGENRTLLTVAGKDSSFKVVGTLLAKELQLKNSTVNNGDYFLLRIYPMAMDMIVVRAPGQSFSEATYIPLTSATMAIKTFGEKRAFTLSEVLQLVKRQIPLPSKD